MYRYGTLSSGVPLGPTVPTASPSPTVAPFDTPIEPRCVSVTEYPSGVAIVTDLPLAGTVPAKVTTPPAGATTAVPVPAPMSIPRCWPPAYGCAESNVNPSRTGPWTGHVHALAAGAHSTSSRTTRTNRRMAVTSVVSFENEAATLATRPDVVKAAYREPR